MKLLSIADLIKLKKIFQNSPAFLNVSFILLKTLKHLVPYIIGHWKFSLINCSNMMKMPYLRFWYLKSRMINWSSLPLNVLNHLSVPKKWPFERFLRTTFFGATYRPLIYGKFGKYSEIKLLTFRKIQTTVIMQFLHMTK